MTGGNIVEKVIRGKDMHLKAAQKKVLFLQLEWMKHVNCCLYVIYKQNEWALLDRWTEPSPDSTGPASTDRSAVFQWSKMYARGSIWPINDQWVDGQTLTDLEADNVILPLIKIILEKYPTLIPSQELQYGHTTTLNLIS